MGMEMLISVTVELLRSAPNVKRKPTDEKIRCCYCMIRSWCAMRQMNTKPLWKTKHMSFSYSSCVLFGSEIEQSPLPSDRMTAFTLTFDWWEVSFSSCNGWDGGAPTAGGCRAARRAIWAFNDG